MANIISDSWAQIIIRFDGRDHSFKDAAIVPGSAQEWDWNWNLEAGPMKHKPGIRTIDIDHFILSLPEQPDAVILTQGRLGVLRVDESLNDYLHGKGIKEVYIMKTATAIEKYNELIADGKKVAGLFHTTC